MKNRSFTCEWRIEKSKNNEDILVINNRYIHSRFSPTNEASDFKQEGSCLILIFGLGLAYHVHNIIKNNPDSSFIIYEPCKEIYNLKEKYLDNQLFNKYKNNICLLNKFDYNEIFNFIEKNYYITDIKTVTYSNLGYKVLFQELEIEFYNIVKKTIDIYIQNVLTESNFIPLWTKNFIYNIKNLSEKSFFIPKKSNIEDNIAVICSAGPSLIHDISIMKNNRDKITIFTVDTALKVLLKNNINPDFIISVDSQSYSLEDFQKNIPEESTLIMDIVSYPPISRLSKNIFYTITKSLFKNTIIEYFFYKNNIDIFGIETGGTVSDYCLYIANSLGFKKVYMAGLDLSYPNLLSHCKGTPFYEGIINKSNYFDTPESLAINTISKRDIKKINSRVINKSVFSDFVLQNYAFYLDKYKEINKNINLYYYSNDGIEIDNIIKINLDALINNYSSKRLNLEYIIKNSEKVLISKEKLINFYDFLLESIYEKSKILNDYFINTDFSVENIDKINEWNLLYDSINKEFPFLKKFIIMTEIILNRQKISKNSLIWYKHTGYKIIQSIYFIIRVLQKIKNTLQ